MDQIFDPLFDVYKIRFLKKNVQKFFRSELQSYERKTVYKNKNGSWKVFIYKIKIIEISRVTKYSVAGVNESLSSKEVSCSPLRDRKKNVLDPSLIGEHQPKKIL